MTKYLLLVVLASSVIGRPSGESARESLRGIRSVRVYIDVQGEELIGETIAPVITIDTELNLREHKLRVIDDDTALADCNMTVFVNILETTYSSGATTGWYSVSISVEVDQFCRLGRNDSSTIATTWSSGRILYTDNLQSRIREVVSNDIDKFLNDWMASNPPTKSP